MDVVQGASIKYNDNDEHLLRRIAGAVIYHWDSLPAEIQKLILEQAPFMLDRNASVQLEPQIRMFIEARKGGKHPCSLFCC